MPADPRIAYAPAPPPVSRRAFRLVLAVTILNSAVLATDVVGPLAWRAGQGRWATVRRWRATRAAAAVARAARVATLPAQSRCLTYAAPAERLVYAEAAADVARLGPATRPAGSARWTGGVYVFNPGQSLPMNAVPAVAAADPPGAAGVPAVLRNDAAEHGVLFLHARRATATAPERLVVVTVDDDVAVRPSAFTDGRAESTCNFGLLPVRRLTGTVIVPATADADATVASSRTTLLTARRPTVVTESTPVAPPDGSIGRKRVGPSVDRYGPAGRLRFYAGQADPADPAALSIGWQFDPPDGSTTRHGTLTGRLTADDHLDLHADPALAEVLGIGPDEPTPPEPQFAVPSPPDPR